MKITPGVVIAAAVAAIISTCVACSTLQDGYNVTPAEAGVLLEAAEAVYERADDWDGPVVDLDLQNALLMLQQGLAASEDGPVSIAGLGPDAKFLVGRHNELLETQVTTGQVEYDLAKAFLIDGNALLYGLQVDPDPVPDWVLDLVPTVPVEPPSGPFSSIHEADIWAIRHTVR